ncbi:MAG: hypothetical protein ACXVPU_02930 [Bacteroidia bacterium]
MQDTKNIVLLERQLKDIISQAENILSGQNSATQIETFSKYSEELKSYVIERIEDPKLKERANKIEKVNFKRNELKLWHYVTFSFWIVLLIQYTAMQKSVEEIGRVKSDWSTFLFELQSQGTT